MRNLNIKTESYMIHKVYICFLKAETILVFMFCNSPLWIWQIEKKNKQTTYSKATYVRRVAAEKMADIPHPI